VARGSIGRVGHGRYVTETELLHTILEAGYGGFGGYALVPATADEPVAKVVEVDMTIGRFLYELKADPAEKVIVGFVE
jgi:hypothetical protein